MKVKRKMGSLAVVVIDVLPKNQLQVALAENEQPVQGFAAQSLDHPLAMGVGSRPPVGCEGDLCAFAAEHLIELVDELGIPVMYGEPDWRLELVQLPAQVPGLLSDPGGIGMGGAVGVENPAAADLQEDKHVESPKQHRVDGEEVAGKNCSGVGGEKLGPSRTIAARCRRQAMTAQDAADGSGRDLVAELEEFALNATIAPTWVLAAQTQNQVAQLIRDWRPASPRAQGEGSPTPAHQLPMPAEQRGGREEQAPRRQSQAERNQDHPVGRQQLWPPDLPTQNRDLVAEGENLKVALGVRATAQYGQADRQPQQHIDRRVEHEAGD